MLNDKTKKKSTLKMGKKQKINRVNLLNPEKNFKLTTHEILDPG
jgi:hypothetical protein